MNEVALGFGALLLFHHEHGLSVMPCATPQAAQQELALYAARWWGEKKELADIPVPADPTEAVARFFERVTETYSIIDLNHIPVRVREERSDAAFRESFARSVLENSGPLALSTAKE